jgi:hypothetical protein
VFILELNNYDFSPVENYNIEEIRKRIKENFKTLEESIKELKESNSKISNNLKQD